LHAQFSSPPEVQRDDHDSQKNGNNKPHGNYLATDEAQMEHRFLFTESEKKFLSVFHL
jgi:hypothetical protein